MSSTNTPGPRPVALVVPHTHWDRAWYWPFERFRIRLIEFFTILEERFHTDPAFSFLLDGQAIMLEDYLEACPQHRDFLETMAREGRLKIGPLYILPDVYCTGGEAYIRNLLVGLEIAESFGGVSRVVHMPDTFGIIPEMPMLVAGAGFDTFSFMRGTTGGDIGKQTRMFTWHGPDGSQVQVFRLRDGYANAAGLGNTKPARGMVTEFNLQTAVQRLIAAANNQMAGQTPPPYLLLAGVDHQFPQTQLSAIMEAATASSDIDFVYADLDVLARVMREQDHTNWPHFQGEFHGSGAASVLGGTISARLYLKQMNAAAERALVSVAEPADAIATLFGCPDPAGGALLPAWKHVLKNHPHDDICGCSVDAVHQDNEQHFRQALIGADALRRRMVKHIVERIGTQRADDTRFGLLVMNAQPVPRQDRVRMVVDFEGMNQYSDCPPLQHYALVDEAGRELPFREIQRGPSSEHPHQALTLEMDLSLPPMTPMRLFFEPRDRWATTKQRKGRLENAHLQVTARKNGTFDLLDKQTGTRSRGLGLFSDQGDIGDTYDFHDLKDDREVFSTDEQWEISTGGGCAGLQLVTLSGRLRIPAETTSAGRAFHHTEVPVTVELSLGQDARQVEVRLIFTNTAKDHRLRWNLPLTWRPEVSRAGLKFSEITRPAGPAPKPNEKQRLFPEHPADHYVAVEHAAGGLAVFSEFPINYEVVHGRRERLAITVLRATGMLSRTGAGPNTPTPEAQCLRSFDLRFAVRPFAPADSGSLFFESALWRSAPITGLLHDPATRWTESRDTFTGPFLQVVEGDILLSALKRAHQGEQVLVRFFNPHAHAVIARVAIHGVNAITPFGLQEEPTGEPSLVPDAAGLFTIPMPPNGLRTFALAGEACWAE